MRNMSTEKNNCANNAPIVVNNPYDQNPVKPGPRVFQLQCIKPIFIAYQLEAKTGAATTAIAYPKIPMPIVIPTVAASSTIAYVMSIRAEM